MVEGGAPGHKWHFKKYRELNGMDVFSWPVQPPDFNLIEELWGDIDVELGQIWRKVSDPEALEGSIEYYSEERLKGLIRSTPYRLQAAIDANGYPNPY